MRTLLNKIRKLRASIRLCITMVAYFTHWTNFWNNFVIYYRRRLWLLNSVLPVHPFDNSCKPVIFADRQCNLFTKTSQHNIVFLFGNTEIFYLFFLFVCMSLLPPSCFCFYHESQFRQVYNNCRLWHVVLRTFKKHVVAMYIYCHNGLSLNTKEGQFLIR